MAQDDLPLTACVRCGSINLRPAEGTALDRLITSALQRPRLVCSRCGWEGRIRPATPTRQGRRVSTKGAPYTPSPGHAEEVDLDELDAALDTKIGDAS